MSLKELSLINKVYLLQEGTTSETIEGYEILNIDSIRSTSTVKKIAEKLINGQYTIDAMNTAYQRINKE